MLLLYNCLSDTNKHKSYIYKGNSIFLSLTLTIVILAIILYSHNIFIKVDEDLDGVIPLPRRRFGMEVVEGQVSIKLHIINNNY